MEISERRNLRPDYLLSAAAHLQNLLANVGLVAFQDEFERIGVPAANVQRHDRYLRSGTPHGTALRMRFHFLSNNHSPDQ